MAKIYLYKVVVDIGGAPCVHDGKLSLAICKPQIRKSAEPGDWVLGFAGNSLNPDNQLIYAAKVSGKLNGSEYYTDKYKNRPDCIYEFTEGTYQRRHDAKYHDSTEGLAHDLGDSPTYERACVLITDNTEDFRYYGRSCPNSDRSCPIDYRAEYPELAAFVQEMGRGHRVNHSKSIRDAVLSLLDYLQEAERTPEDTCVPKGSSSSKCGEDDGSVECNC